MAVVIEMEVTVTMEVLVTWATQRAAAAFTHFEWRQHC